MSPNDRPSGFLGYCIRVNLNIDKKWSKKPSLSSSYHKCLFQTNEQYTTTTTTTTTISTTTTLRPSSILDIEEETVVCRTNNGHISKTPTYVWSAPDCLRASFFIMKGGVYGSNYPISNINRDGNSMWISFLKAEFDNKQLRPYTFKIVLLEPYFCCQRMALLWMFQHTFRYWP